MVPKTWRCNVPRCYVAILSQAPNSQPALIGPRCLVPGCYDRCGYIWRCLLGPRWLSPMLMYLVSLKSGAAHTTTWVLCAAVCLAALAAVTLRVRRSEVERGAVIRPGNCPPKLKVEKAAEPRMTPGNWKSLNPTSSAT